MSTLRFTFTIVTIAILLLSAVVYQYLVNTYSAPLNDAELANTYAIITGSSSGIGREMAYVFCKAKANVIIAGTNTQKLKKVENKCKTLGAKSIHSIAVSLDSLSNCNSFVDQALAILKQTNSNNKIRLDYFMLNHAFIPPIAVHLNPNTTHNRTHLNNILSNAEWAFQVNTMSYINLATLFYPVLHQSNGRIVVSNSGAGRLSLPKHTVYSSNKFALNGFFESLRKEINADMDCGVSITICIIGLTDTVNVRENVENAGMRISIFGVHVVQDFANATLVARDMIGGGQKRLKTVHTPFTVITMALATNDYATPLMDMLLNYAYFGW